MAITFATPNTILGTLQPKTQSAQLVNTIVIAFLGTILLTISAKINIPYIPVPATFQTLVVAGLSAAFGWRVGVATVALYLLEGMMGLPVFSRGGGADYLLGPTGGFLIGYLPAAFLIGKLADMGASRKLLPLFLAMIAGDAIIFAFGFAWLMTFAGSVSWLDQANVLGSAYAIAVEPFIIWDVLKMAFAAITVFGIWAAIKQHRS